MDVSKLKLDMPEIKKDQNSLFHVCGIVKISLVKVFDCGPCPFGQLSRNSAAVSQIFVMKIFNRGELTESDDYTSDNVDWCRIAIPLLYLDGYSIAYRRVPPFVGRTCCLFEFPEYLRFPGLLQPIVFALFLRHQPTKCLVLRVSLP